MSVLSEHVKHLVTPRRATRGATLYNSQGITEAVTVGIWFVPYHSYVDRWAFQVKGTGASATVTIGKNGTALSHTHVATSPEWVPCVHTEGELELLPEDELQIFITSPAGGPTQIGVQCDIVRL